LIIVIFFAVVVFLSRALPITLDKDFFRKILNISLPRARDEALGEVFFNKIFAEGPSVGV